MSMRLGWGQGTSIAPVAQKDMKKPASPAILSVRQDSQERISVTRSSACKICDLAGIASVGLTADIKGIHSQRGGRATGTPPSARMPPMFTVTHITYFVLLSGLQRDILL
jgi:hypothetical protein